jgi:oxalate decarboxylase
VPERAFASIPAKELFIFQAKAPGPLAAEKVAGAGPVPRTYSHRLLAQKPIRTRGGTVRIVDSTNFPVSTTIAAAFVEVEPGGMREIHWYPNADELQYHISGQARMTVFAAEAAAGTFDFQAGDVGFVPRNMGHYIENTGATKLQFLELWNTDKFADISLRQWLAFTPFELVRAHLKIDKSVVANAPTRKTPVVPA